MSHATESVPLYAAQRAADAICGLLWPVCDRLIVAGSVRRECELVNDLELVAVPKTELSTAGALFPSPVDRLAAWCEDVAAGAVRCVRRPQAREGQRAPAWGERQKRLALFDHGRWFAVDLFIVTPATWGAQLAIRTGSAKFSRMLVTSWRFGGAMPEGCRLEEGLLVTPQGRLEADSEEDFFGALGLPWWEPRLRSEGNLRRYLEQQA